MIKYEIGDILEAKLDVIFHVANCQTLMKGQFNKVLIQKYPRLSEVDRKYKIPKGVARLGLYSSAKVGGPKDKMVVVNLYAQEHISGPNRKLSIIALKKALNLAMSTLPVNFSKETIIGVPYLMGCKGAGGDWNEVEKLLEEISDKYNVDITIYKLPHSV